MAYHLVSTRTGGVQRADPEPVEYGLLEQWPDFVVAHVTDGAAEPGTVIDLDALPDDYVCTLAELTAVILPPSTEEIKDESGLSITITRPQKHECQREKQAAKGERKAEAEAFAEYHAAQTKFSTEESALGWIEHSLGEKDKTKSLAWQIQKLALDQAAAAVPAKKAAHESEKQKTKTKGLARANNRR